MKTKRRKVSKTKMAQAKKILKPFKAHIKRVQTYEGERYSEDCKKALAKMVTLIGRSKTAELAGLYVRQIRDWDMKYNGTKSVPKNAPTSTDKDRMLEALKLGMAALQFAIEQEKKNSKKSA